MCAGIDVNPHEDVGEDLVLAKHHSNFKLLQADVSSVAEVSSWKHVLLYTGKTCILW